MSDYLGLPLRSLRDLHAETAARVTTLEIERIHADESRHEAIDEELNQMHDRLDVLEEEIAWRDRSEERRDSPIVL